MSKSLISSLPDLSTSYSYEIKELREKVLYWKRTSEIHHLEGCHILGELYKTYMLKAQEELDLLLKEEKEEKEEEKELETPKHFFIKEKVCSFYSPILPILKEEEKETEEALNS